MASKINKLTYETIDDSLKCLIKQYFFANYILFIRLKTLKA